LHDGRPAKQNGLPEAALVGAGSETMRDAVGSFFDS
jgi:hypothetical protein